MRNILISDYVIDANEWSEQTINGFVQSQLDKKYGVGVMKFNYQRTAGGYRYTLSRKADYMVRGQLIMDRDCSLLSGLPIEKFQVGLGNPGSRPMIFVLLYGNAFYAPIEEFVRLYRQLIGVGDDTETPTRVNVSADSSVVSVEVTY